MKGLGKIFSALSLFALLVVSAAVGNIFEPEAACAAVVSVREASISMKTDGDFIKGRSKATVAFKIGGSAKVTVRIVDDSGETIYKKKYAKCKSGRRYSFDWDGRENGGEYAPDGEYHVTIKAKKSSMTSENSVYFYNMVEFDSGNGSKDSPYLVSDAAQLQAVTKYNGKYFVQNGDVDFTGIAFSPLFDVNAAFSGVYDGNGFSINGISYQSSGDYVGIFRAVAAGGVVKNVTLNGSSFSGKNDIGGIVGKNWGTISDCKVNDTIINGDEDTAAVAAHNVGKVEGCVTSNNIVSGTDNAGAIVGYCEAAGYISSCTSSTDTINVKDEDAGGIVGSLDGTVSGCKANDDTVYAGDDDAGGIAGENKGVIKNCEVSDLGHKIDARYYKGGIVGRNYGTMVDCAYYGELEYIG